MCYNGINLKFIEKRCHSMYDITLETFITAADCGSFTKTAERLFISPTAVMKQINALESRLELKLFKRNSSGVKLTPAGEIIYKTAKRIIEYSKKAVAEAQAATEAYNTTFCVGTSLLNPAKPFMDLWYKLNGEFPDYKLHLVPFEDDHEGILSEIGKLGEKLDFLIGVCDSKQWLSLCNFEPLGQYKKMIAVPREHPLTHKSSVKLEDLYGETLIMVKRGDSEVNDDIRAYLEKNHPQIKIEDAPQFYDLDVFNRAVQTGSALLTLECWREVHPALVSIPVEWERSIPYGILYPLDPSDDILRFIECVRKNRAAGG